MSTKPQKSYHRRASGPALATVEAHAGSADLQLYGSCFCPFVQRVWISLELKRAPYQYLEIDPYDKTAEFLAVNPRGLIPAIRHKGWNCYESTVLMEFLEELFAPKTGGDDFYPLLPSPTAAEQVQARAHQRLWADHVNRKIIPAFYHVLRAQEAGEQAKEAEGLKGAIAELVDAADPEGPFFTGARIGWVDVQLAPWLLRLRRVLGPYRGWPEPEEGSRWKQWVEAVEADEAVRGTTSEDQLYLDSYERYAENRPGTSQVADAVNQGRGLP